MKGSRIRSLLVALIVSMMFMGAVAPTALAAADFNESASAAQNPYIATDVTVESYDRSTMEPGQYEDDSGEIATLPATVNQSEDVDDIGSGTVNPYQFVATDIDFEDAGAFPHAEENISAVDNETRWTIDESGSAGTMTVADSTTAPGVEALEVTTSSQTDSDTAVATFSDVSITSDAQKRYFQAMLDVNALDTGATVELRAVDSDGDYVATTINTSATASDDDVIATGTGEGYVIQEQIGSLTVAGNGDGTMAEIQEVEVAVMDGNADVRISALNVDKTSEWKLGDERVDTDDEDDFETESMYDVSTPGAIGVYNLETMGTTFDNAEINGLTMPMEFHASDLANDEQEVNVTFTEAAQYPNFENRMDAYYRLELPDAYDLTYAGATLQQDVTLPNSRYQTVEIAEGASDTDFADISGWTDTLGAIGSQGDTVTLDDTIQPGQEIAFHTTVLVTDDEKANLEATATSGGGGGFFGGTGDGPIQKYVLSPIGGAIAAIMGYLRLRGGN